MFKKMDEMTQDSIETPYLVLARKYRPQNFDDLVGQDALVQTFTNAIKNNRLHHAYILTGIRGVGKTTTARIMAKALNCTGLDGKGNATAHPCGVCENCRAIAEDRHIDVIELDAASRTGVDDMREILDGVRYKPTVGRYKVYIIDEVHMLSKSAFNALLKTLEEPPSHVKFIFATTEIRKVPITVLSRCQRFDLRRLTVEELMGLMKKILQKENIEAEENGVEIIAKAADGSARDALSLLDQAISIGDGKIKTDVIKNMIGFADRGQVLSLFSDLLSGNMEKVLKNLQKQYQNGANPQSLLNDLIELNHLLLKSKLVPDSTNLFAMTEAEKNLCNNLSESVSVAVLSKIWQMLIKGVSEMQIAPSAIDALEMILVRIAYSANLPTPAELLESVKKNSDINTNRQIITPIAQKNAPVFVPQQIQPEPIAAQTIQEKPAETNNKTESKTPFALNDFINYLENHKKMLLLYALKNDLSFSEFADGYAKLRMSDKMSRETFNSLRNILEEASGYSWKFDIESGPLQETIADQENAKLEQNKRNIQTNPLVKAILDEFKGAKIETLVRKQTEDSENSTIEDNVFYEGDI